MQADEIGGLIVGLLCCLGVVLVIAALPLYSVVVGFRRRRRAQEHVAAAEPRLRHLVTTTTQAGDHRGPTTLVVGTTAYAADFPSRWATSWRNLVGGQAVSLTEQADLARRIAYTRMLEDAAAKGAVGVVNIRLETSQIDMSSGGQQRGQAAMVIEMLAYGTALLPPTASTEPRG